ncbi:MULTISPECIES: flagellar hook protein FlgE [Ramlibacter]|uniref:Flagellar hook-basal body complex protein n=1 Tax=Ramlibacter pinisoli TaxID=2682844 RepID=A0A6N8ISN2_9BURK|nr:MULTISPECIES: flagellar hook-basal body complex protein [Ramlibacter]MBA2964777.1 flagellar hook-basal body complex protein [Ramlibacter sp. CGMCC 1.13660]MVQ29742.1 flagellar hook-basal body complex protein [Ramlibacter pinisoli]
MLDSIHVGMTGLQGYSRGLRVIANNTANLDTPGYKASSLQFADLFYTGADQAGGRATQLGHGLATTGTQLDLRQGDLRDTGNPFDLAIDGDGLFVLRPEDGSTRYTRAGNFQFDADGRLVDRANGALVLGRDAAGVDAPLSLLGLKTTAGAPTAVARFAGNLSSTVETQTIPSVHVHDAMGETHELAVKFTRTDDQAIGSWKVELLDGATTVGEATMQFIDGRPDAASGKPSFTYTPAGKAAQVVVLDFSADVTSYAAGNLSTLAMSAQDGRPPGSLTKLTFNARGALVATYSNGQEVEGARLLLARARSADATESAGGNRFVAAGGQPWELGTAGDGGFGAVHAGQLEMSNVDLAREFSELVVMQRGYQASSQVISTANDMLQELLNMKAK